MTRLSGGGGGDSPEASSSEMSEAAQIIQRLKQRVQRLEEARATDPPEGAGSPQSGKVLSPISRVVDRVNTSETVSVSTSVEPGALVIDDFEDQDVSEYTGSTGQASFPTYPTKHGSYSLKLASATSGSDEDIISTSGLNNYPSDGDTYRYAAYAADDTAGLRHYFGASDVDNTYRITLGFSSNSLQIHRFDGGSSTQLADVSASISSGSWYVVEVAWTSGGGFDVTLYESDGSTQVATASTTDTTYTGGGVGWGILDQKLADEVVGYFDFARVTTSANVIDDFEDADVSEYSGDTGSATVKNDAELGDSISPEHGTYALELTGTATIHAVSGNLNDDAVAGDTFESHHRLASGSVVRFLFGLQDGSNYYYVEADNSNGNWVLGKVDGGTDSTIASDTSVTVPTTEWLSFQVEWGSGGSITATLYDSADSQVAQVSGSDSTWSSGGHGWTESASSTTSYHDYALVTPGGTQTSGSVDRTGVIDDFEDGDVAEYDGDTTYLSAQTTTVQEGTYAGEIADNTTTNSTVVSSTSGLPRYPKQGDKFEVWVRTEPPQGITLYGMRWAVQQDGTGYAFRLRSWEDRFQLVELGSGQLAEVSVSLTDGEWYRVEVEWALNGEIFVTLYDTGDNELATLTAFDSTYTDGGIGFRNYTSDGGTPTGTAFQFDYARITGSPSAKVIDDFEDNNISEYSEAAGSWAVQSTTVKEGTYAVENTGQPGSGRSNLISTSGLNTYPAPNTECEVWVYLPSGADAGPTWAVQDVDNYYHVVANTSDSFTLYVKSGGSFTQLASASPTVNSGWHRIVFEWYEGGAVGARLYDPNGEELADIDAADSTYTSAAGFGCRAGGSNGCVFDYATREDVTDYSAGIVDDFEDGDIDEYGAETGEFSVSTTQVQSGSYALYHPGDGSSSDGDTLSSDSDNDPSLDRYPTRGDTFEYHFYLPSTGSNANLLFGGPYYLKQKTGQSEMELRSTNGESFASASVTYPTGEWLRCVIDFQATITVTLYDSSGSQLAQLSATDTQYTGERIGFDLGADQEAYFDAVEITST